MRGEAYCHTDDIGITFDLSCFHNVALCMFCVSVGMTTRVEQENKVDLLESKYALLLIQVL